MAQSYDVIVLGAGAAGLMAALTAGARGRRVLLLEHSSKIGEKIRISGGGRCNFTNLYAAPQNYISQNPHFIKSALACYTQQDFMKLVSSHGIAYHEKTLGQLFCDGSSKQIIEMLVDLCHQGGVEIKTQVSVENVQKLEAFDLKTTAGNFRSESLVVATGGLSIPLMGASDFGYKLAKQFGLKIVPTKPALVPLVIEETMRQKLSVLSGVSKDAVVSYGGVEFRENILFTHKGVSGPAILQISSYLKSLQGEKIALNLLPGMDLKQQFMDDKHQKQTVANYLKTWLPNRLVDYFASTEPYQQKVADLKKEALFQIADHVQDFKILITGSEGYQKAEVTVGGVDTRQLSSKTMETKTVPGLYFIGEVVDVTGWLGGYNFQWAWSSGVAAGKAC